ncbi:MAG: hypothetical protein HY896_01990 [Deltaproteobacteria bacterium]|nr:hypothetical protein [Deltaproteobacteria bacterium]
MIDRYSIIALAIAFFLIGPFALAPEAADVIVVGDTQLKPVVEMIAGIRQTYDSSFTTYSPSEVRGRLRSITEKEKAKVIVALGKDALADALGLPSSTLVIYDLVVTPPAVSRPNTTGFYMGTPVKEYVDLINEHLHSIRKMAVVGTRDQLSVLDREENRKVVSYRVKNAGEFVDTLRRLDSADAILLPPDISLLTATALEEAYLLSFRKKIPLLGISEKNVRQGALLALVFDPANVGRRIGEYAAKAVKGTNVGQVPPSPPQRFDLYLNSETARKMGIQLPIEIVRKAKKIYP